MDNHRLTFLALNVSDLRNSFNFYRNILGVPIKEASHDSKLQDPWYGGPHAAYSWTDGGFIHFAIYPSREPERPTTTSAQLGFHVSDFDKVHRKIEETGITVLQGLRKEPWGRTVRYQDPDGNIVSITER